MRNQTSITAQIAAEAARSSAQDLAYARRLIGAGGHSEAVPVLEAVIASTSAQIAITEAQIAAVGTEMKRVERELERVERELDAFQIAADALMPLLDCLRALKGQDVVTAKQLRETQRLLRTFMTVFDAIPGESAQQLREDFLPQLQAQVHGVEARVRKPKRRTAATA